jgi:anaerobic selenocysteine-containing dehydrogenase
MVGFTQLTDLLLFYGNAVAGFAEAAAQYTPAVIPKPAGSDVLEDWEFFYGVAQRLGLDLRIAGGAHWIPGSPAPVALDMQNKPTTDELLDILAGGSRVPLDEIRANPGQHLYPSTMIVEPKDPGWPHRLDVANPDMMSDLDVAAHTRSVDDASFPYRLLSRRVQQLLNSAYNIPATNRGRSHNVAYFHPDDLQSLGVAPNSLVDITSQRATIRVPAGEDHNLRPGTLSMTHCYGGLPGDDEDPLVVGGSTSRLLSIDSRYDRYSGQPLMSNIPVNVVKVS